MKRLPPLTELRAFEAAARHLSFQAAAGELGVTPTAISHQIRLLEEHCGQKLFRRRPRPLSLTAAGEQLFPVLRDGFADFSDALASIRDGAAARPLRVTATNAFAARWLVPQLPRWRRAHPDLPLDIAGTDAVLRLEANEADVAIRYARTSPKDGASLELLRDRFHVIGAPCLVGRSRKPRDPATLARLPLIEAEWSPADRLAPTWARWEAVARETHRKLPSLAGRIALRFREELHAIDAVIAGQGIALLSDVLVGRELADGTLVRLSEIVLPGYGFYAVWRPEHRRATAIAAFTTWLQAMAVASETAASRARRR